MNFFDLEQFLKRLLEPMLFSILEFVSYFHFIPPFLLDLFISSKISDNKNKRTKISKKNNEFKIILLN